MAVTARPDGFVGVFDSGVGGISVLRSLVAELPHEDFEFFGDSANAPYGEKTAPEVLGLSRSIVEDFVAEGAKCIVIACNTATSAAAQTLRAEYGELPIVGVEPALKPATLAPRHGRILVMATPMTLRLDKFHKLAERWGSDSEVIGVPCVGLASRIEQGNLDAPDVIELIDSLIGRYAGTVDAVVLGCTHYSFVASQIREVIGDVPLFDGAHGTALQLQRKLAERGLLTCSMRPGNVEFLSSNTMPEELALYRRFLES